MVFQTVDHTSQQSAFGLQLFRQSFQVFEALPRAPNAFNFGGPNPFINVGITMS